MKQTIISREYGKVKRRPDMVLILAVAFGMGVLITLLMPMSAGDTLAAPASPLQAGLISDR